jgi:parallel beta-helix repeat protein
MFKSFGWLLFSIAFVVLTCFSALTAQEYVGGTLTQNTVYSPVLNPYIVVENLIVPEGVTLFIQPGTQLFFMVRVSIRVEGGTLIADGLAEQPILFDAQTENKWDGINYFISKTQFDDAGNYLNGNILRHVNIQQTTVSVVLSDSAILYADSINIENGDHGFSLHSGSSIVLSNSVIDQCSFGMSIKNSGSNSIKNCRISNCDIGIFFPSNNESRYNNISNNTITNNRIIGLFMNIGQSRVQFNRIAENSITYNDIGLYLGNGGEGDLGYNNILSNRIQFNRTGIKLSQDADTLRGNLIESNTTGLLLIKARRNSITNNIIQQNAQAGILLNEGSSFNQVLDNGIYANSTGIRVTHENFNYSANNQFKYNQLSDNMNEAFLFESGPQLPLEFNSITGTSDTNIIVNRFYADLQAPNNWFGTTDTAIIDSLIYDYFDHNEFGKVIYKPFLGNPDPHSPISKPLMVVKRLVGNQVLVDWHRNIEVDLAGYKVHYGPKTGNVFENTVNIGLDTLVLISGISLSDTVAVTAYDTDTTGYMDQFEGHESAYSYAFAGPWAGNDLILCQGETYTTSAATAVDVQYIRWTTSGDGSFVDPDKILTTYIPGFGDIMRGSVTLTIEQFLRHHVLTDNIVLIIMKLPAVNAGHDTLIYKDDIFYSTDATAANFDGLWWTSVGDGAFADSLSLITSYSPGQMDNAQGYVVLILNLTSFCGNISDSLTIEIVPACSINGRVLKNAMPEDNSVVVAIKTGTEGAKAMSTAYSNAEGLFGFNRLPVGNYLLYAVSDPQTDRYWAPTYYAESLHWQSAYQLPLNTNVYDIDIKLTSIADQLPEGEGAISGSFSYDGKAADEDSIYNKPWFDHSLSVNAPTIGDPAANHTVLLMNADTNRVFAWDLTNSVGGFSFSQLPYGRYRLWGEKAGYVNSVSPVITLAPGSSEMEGVLLSIHLKNIEVTLPPANYKPGNELLYPNPASSWLWINESVFGDLQQIEVRLTDVFGRQSKQVQIERTVGSAAEIDVSDLDQGIYVCFISGSNGFSASYKFVIVR